LVNILILYRYMLFSNLIRFKFWTEKILSKIDKKLNTLTLLKDKVIVNIFQILNCLYICSISIMTPRGAKFEEISLFLFLCHIMICWAIFYYICLLLKLWRILIVTYWHCLIIYLIFFWMFHFIVILDKEIL